MSDMNESLDNIITLTDENGKEADFEFADLIEHDSREFVVLFPVDDEEDDGQVVILEIQSDEDSDEESYISVDDEDLLNEVFEIFKEKYAEVYDFE